MKFSQEADAEIKATASFIESIGDIESFCLNWSTANILDSHVVPRVPSQGKYRSGYSTELLHRKKAKLEDLREQVQVMEEWLKRLRKAPHSTTKNADENLSAQYGERSQRWARTTFEEYAKRRQAENINRKLKSIQANQTTVTEELLKLLSASSNFDDQEFVFTNQLYVVSKEEDAVMATQLSERASELYLRTDGVFPADLPLFGCRLQLVEDNKCGKTVELVGSVPLDCSAEEAHTILWKEQKKMKDVENSFLRYLQNIDDDTFAKGFDVNIHPHNDDIAHFRGLQIVRKFQDNNQRVVYVSVSKFFVPGEDFQLCGHFWIVISNVQAQCHVQFYGHIFSEDPNKILLRDEQLLDAWGLRMRMFWLTTQEAMVDAVAGQKLVATQAA